MLLVVFALIRCSNTTKILQDRYYINPEIVPKGYANRNKSNDYDYKQIESNLTENLNEFMVILKDRYSKCRNSKMKFNVEKAELKVKLERIQRTELTRKAEETINAEVPFANLYIKFDSSYKYQHQIELEFTRKNPQYQLEYFVNPKQLIDKHFNSKQFGGLAFVIFSKKIIAPELFVMTKSENIDFLSAFYNFVSLSKKEKIVTKTYFSNEFIVREFEKPELIDLLINSPLRCIDPKTKEKVDEYFAMFVWEERLKECAIDSGAFEFAPESKKKFYQPNELVVNVKDKDDKIDRYRLNPYYAEHLIAEGVTFDCSKPENCNFVTKDNKLLKAKPSFKESQNQGILMYLLQQFMKIITPNKITPQEQTP